MAPREGRRMSAVVNTQQRPCLFLASLLSFLPVFHSANPNSEGSSSSAQANSRPSAIFSFLIANSALPTSNL